MNRCTNCMNLKPSEMEKCPNCGYETASKNNDGFFLPEGIHLNDRYFVGIVLGNGGFGITYKAYDEKLDITVAIKEYLPTGIASRLIGSTTVSTYGNDSKKDFQYGLERFIEEAKILVKFNNTHQGIVSVNDYFVANNTAYIVMEYIEGINLKQYFENNKVYFSERQALGLMLPIIDALSEVHRAGIIHRDISPDNIMFTETGTIKLIDFGAARFATSQKSQNLSVIVKSGYAPPEQYFQKSNQGPWTDVYAVAATLTKLMTGITPMTSVERLASKQRLTVQAINKIDNQKLVDILNRAMQLEIDDRYSSMEDFREDLLALYGTSLSEQERSNTYILTRSGLEGVTSNVKHAAPAQNEVIKKEKDSNYKNRLSNNPSAVESKSKEIETSESLPGNNSLNEVAPNNGETFAFSRNSSSLNPKEPDKENKKKKSKKKLMLILSACILLLAISSAAVFGFSQLSKNRDLLTTDQLNRDMTCEVPGFISLAKDDADKLASDNEIVIIFEEDYSTEIKAGYIISQDISEGSVINSGDTVKLTVSKGPEHVTVPNTVGSSIESALSALTDLGFDTVILEEYNEKIEKGLVISQNINPGVKIEYGSQLQLTVSLGNSDESDGLVVVVPDVEGKPTQEAVKELEQANLKTQLTEENSYTVDADIVILQTNKSSEVPEGTTISLTVSIGPKMISIPNVVGKIQSIAVTELENAEFIPVVTTDNNANVPVGSVISQNPGAGNIIPGQSNVTIVISSGKKQIILPNVEGMSQEDGQKALVEAGFKYKAIEVLSKDTEEGNIINQKPTAGVKIDENSVIDLYIGTGPGDVQTAINELPEEVQANIDSYEITQKTQYCYIDKTYRITPMSDWSSTKPSGDNIYEKEEQYRTKTKETAWFTDNPGSPWESTGNEQWTGDYTAYGSWSSWSTTAVTATELREVEQKTQYHYTRGIWWYEAMGYYSSTYSLNYALAHNGVARYSDWMDSAWPVRGETDGYTKYTGTLEYGTRTWWNQTTRKVYRYRTRTKIMEKEYTKWADTWSSWKLVAYGNSPEGTSSLLVETEYRFNEKEWYWPTNYSSWSSTKVTASSTRRVKERILFTYRQIRDY